MKLAVISLLSLSYSLLPTPHSLALTPEQAIAAYEQQIEQDLFSPPSLPHPITP